MNLWQKEQDSINAQIARLVQMYHSLVDVESKKPRPGVTDDQIAALLETVKKMNALIQRGIREVSASNEKALKSHNEVRDHFIKLQKKYGHEHSPMVKKMFNL